MHCSNCNKIIPDGAAHCPYCYSAQNLSNSTSRTTESMFGGNRVSSYVDTATLKERYGRPFIGFPEIITMVIIYIIFLILSSKGYEEFRNAGFSDAFDFWCFLLVTLSTVPAGFLWQKISKFSEILPVDPVHIGTRILDIVISIGCIFLPGLLPYYMLTAWTIILAMFTLVKLQTVAHILGSTVMSAVIVSGVTLTAFAVITWIVDTFELWIVLFGIIMAVHILIMVLTRSLWVKSALYQYRRGQNPGDFSDYDDFDKTDISASKIICKNCGKEIPADCDFCLKCGERVVKQDEPTTIICKKCGKEIPADCDFCLKCGARIISLKKSK